MFWISRLMIYSTLIDSVDSEIDSVEYTINVVSTLTSSRTVGSNIAEVPFKMIVCSSAWTNTVSLSTLISANKSGCLC